MSVQDSANPFIIQRCKISHAKYQDYVLPVYAWLKHNIYPDKRILNSMLKALIEACGRSTKVLVVRFDLHVREYSENNSVISQFSQKYSLLLEKEYPKAWCKLIWAREHGRSPRQHYHCVLLINGQKVHHPKKLMDKTKMLWTSTTGGLLSLPTNCYYLWKRGDMAMFGRIVYRLSYLAKNITKKRINPQVKRFGCQTITKYLKVIPTQSLHQLLNSEAH
ncbi:YagK/YfjJ domain-containing protein [Rosenbergiella epipactidis]|uniref:YagK/YfjJ domain-containing protein n=1 Tax=Rosenbergiella epipactidis TaxID=1544694 RepID=UPI001F4F0C24|nr:inovirus-type Gp2 protein [Rosenbergiella epipactidis]